MSEVKSGFFDFSDALRHLKQGRAVSRAGWNASGMFVYRVPAAEYPAQTGIAIEYFGKTHVNPENGVSSIKVPYNAYYALKTAQETVATWVPSSTDMEADDWELLGLGTDDINA